MAATPAEDAHRSAEVSGREVRRHAEGDVERLESRRSSLRERRREIREPRPSCSKRKKIPDPKIQALWDRGEPSPTYILRRGSPSSFGPLVEPGVPSALISGLQAVRDHASPGRARTRPGGAWRSRTGWCSPNHPLTARVMVNRIWAQHFGDGIVKSLGNFGQTGAPPSNPELLDWLAVEFVKQQWSMKAMHRLMMTSTAYRQSSAVTPALEKADPGQRAPVAHAAAAHGRRSPERHHAAGGRPAGQPHVRPARSGAGARRRPGDADRDRERLAAQHLREAAALRICRRSWTISISRR